ncbi:exonuclease SbcD [Parabacteroides sp. PFB2-12]|uniref:exonuclease SbcCD subunit D n=1 Tax=unclassified Parabacteroides TaxID=2649774 RepID=UPI0024757DF0|nr:MULTISPECIES: exonuclease SbcCD subunit D C-terminal domain-containing protein [unclassified Parabacteroides]MDH6341948.1 exonuclease SbcD [Parabacteroides sp. PM6-13]MDH6389646.1 exonuclease SbcD [Parabacteroides sp. PFB2-12]
MRLIHTADWHLGQLFFDYDRKAEHMLFLEWLKGKIGELRVDLLLIAGDIFDSPNPSAESQRMYYHFLRDVTAANPELQIIIIAGNHDSAARLEAPNPLLEDMRISVRGVVKRLDDGEIDFEHLIVPLDKGGYCLAVPYLRQGDYPDAETYTQGVRNMYEDIYRKVENRGAPIIAMGHLQATGSEISETDRSERTIIGGLECVSPDSFHPDIVYTALGHLHRAQRVSKRENLRYAGAPLPMSFAEKNNKQGVTLVEITDTTKIERIEFDAPVKLLSIPAEPMPLSDVLLAIAELPEGEIDAASPYLEIKIAITEPEPSLRHQIEEALKTKSVRLARIVAITPKRDTEMPTISYEQLQTINPMDMAIDIYRRRFGGEDMPEKMKTLLQGLIREEGI